MQIPSLRAFLPYAWGIWELSLRIKFIEMSRNIPRWVLAINSSLFPEENVYFFTRSFRDVESRAEQDGDLLFPVTPVGTHHCGSRQPSRSIWAGDLTHNIPRATITRVICSAGVLSSPHPSWDTLASLGSSHEDCHVSLF